MGVVDDLVVVETVGYLNSSFPHQTTKKLLELINEFSKAEINTQGTKSIHKNQLSFYTLIMCRQKEKLKNNPIYNCIQKKP